MKKIAMPVFENRISNRLDCSENIILYSVDQQDVKSYRTIHLVKSNPTAKLNLLLELDIDVLICNGITNYYSQKLTDNNIQVIPWISGEAGDVLHQYLNGELIPVFPKNESREI
jgi:predicted Fe-Mo cluster-binding NifX family protein